MKNTGLMELYQLAEQQAAVPPLKHGRDVASRRVKRDGATHGACFDVGT